jgi:micrococcal nuclease
LSYFTKSAIFVDQCCVGHGICLLCGRPILGQKSHAYSVPWKQITSVHALPSSSFGSKSGVWLRGRAVSVSDGDTFRFLHVPTVFSPSNLRGSDAKLTDVTIPIRVCTIDTPETAKFGNKGQVFAEEAKTKFKSIVLDKIVSIQLLEKDQYSRAVALVRVGTFWPFLKYVDEEMLKAGLAEVYEGSGAVYGRLGSKEAYITIQDKARTSKIGIWSQENRESAKEYKARTKG